ncbi:glycosyltransferase family 4 protein [Halanaerobacter jeridensis]|uniref:Glycosyltransferase involved in cell wall biosynthesis n=1 Tax=Halanaerobacter jeridensis TaxID=706427 RepID=A0A938XT41_9FIRM|nr:glycosyltransferase family 4 protein [Halanaerobacter jeridensis]MBM7557028.1 glycosyltransferase involved in cell wall biosynthesis [Halanaerobacter jeridensis]
MENVVLSHFRVGQTDGVSLEMEKWQTVLEDMGYQAQFLAGSTGNVEGDVIPELKYRQERNDRIVRNAYEELSDFSAQELEAEILAYAAEIKEKLEQYVAENEIDILIPNNIWSLGWHLPAAIAFSQLAEEHSDLQFICHHHDFYWERDLYQPTCEFVSQCLEEYFPPQGDNIEHCVINKLAQEELAERKGIHATVVPNVFDFAAEPWAEDDYNQDFKEQIGLNENDIYMLQATRIAERKAIELAIDVVAQLDKDEYKEQLTGAELYDGRQFTKDSRFVLVLAGLPEGNEEYVAKLKERAQKQGVKLEFVNDLIEMKRCTVNGSKRYSLWDAYVQSDIITYPSILEGWGNQFLEGLFAKKPMVVYEYPVFKTDIKDLGFNIISLGDEIAYRDEKDLVHIQTEKLTKAAQEIIDLLTDRDYYQQVVEENFALGAEHLSYQTLAEILENLLD